MSCNSHKIRFLRQQIPSFDCVPGCHDCCGPVTTSSEEMARLPRKTAAELDTRKQQVAATLDALSKVDAALQGATR